MLKLGRASFETGWVPTRATRQESDSSHDARTTRGRSAVELRRGFTLVELLIVVIILAILAAVAVPQFAASTDEAKAAALDTTLANLRSALDLYYQQHGEYPSANGDGTNAPDSAGAFVAQLSKFTDANGHAQNTGNPTHRYGPYLRRPQMPTEPISNSNALEISTTGTLGLTATGGDPGGWKFDNVTGQIIVNDAAYDDR